MRGLFRDYLMPMAIALCMLGAIRLFCWFVYVAHYAEVM